MILEKLMQLGLWIYGYCTDFIINVSNLSATSYYEVNAFLFCLLWPAVTVVLLAWYLKLKFSLMKADKARINES